ncbi:hypothetical protein PhCBS80983_g03345 [Powellomyces hirtus]|uniref:Uncharacterized protein n=1 Tax=Powellomyces hirtus TaxID=109895 RepID=A0A507E2Y2_9FUNG|nr:hypothetical protein PhCBS80983_g03345 [Powellomyces hirtus]
MPSTSRALAALYAFHADTPPNSLFAHSMAEAQAAAAGHHHQRQPTRQPTTTPPRPRVAVAKPSMPMNHHGAEAQVASMYTSDDGVAAAPDSVNEDVVNEAVVEWEKAKHGRTNNNTVYTTHSRVAPQPSTGKLPQPASTRGSETAREQALMKEMYGRITAAGAADAEGMLDVLLREAKAIHGESKGRTGRDAVRAKL